MVKHFDLGKVAKLPTLIAGYTLRGETKMIELKCENCGGQVARDESQVFVSGSAVIVLAGHGFECRHCDSRFEPGSIHEKHVGSSIAQASGGSVVATGGGIAIRGNVDGDIVVG